MRGMTRVKAKMIETTIAMTLTTRSGRAKMKTTWTRRILKTWTA
jgi:hypothetical protein